MDTMIETERLILRPWRASDRPLMAAIHADPEVMRFLPKALSRAESDTYIARNERHLGVHSYCVWAVEAPGVAALIGAVGLVQVPFESFFTPAVEVGWRLGRAFWRQGYATEAARAAMAYGFDQAGLDSIVALTVPANVGSWRTMERLGMEREAEFEHPNLPLGHALRRHYLYRSRRPQAPPPIPPVA